MLSASAQRKPGNLFVIIIFVFVFLSENDVWVVFCETLFLVMNSMKS